MTTIEIPPTPTSPRTSPPGRTSGSASRDDVADGADVREQLLEGLRLAYEERWRLITGESTPGAAAADLARNSAEIAALEHRCRPRPSVLVRRNGPDPSVFLG